MGRTTEDERYLRVLTPATGLDGWDGGMEV